MWDKRYSGDGFAYGTEPNEFLKEQASHLKGPVLSLAEGEGRNAVFMASLGLDVLGIDQSAVGLAKAEKLAESRGLSIRTQVADLSTIDLPANTFGSAVSIWAHMPGADRKRLHREVERSLRPGGIILLEAYSKKQMGRDSGGPGDVDRLMSSTELESEFPHCEPILSREIERDVHEGSFHNGRSWVVQFIARKQS